MPSRIFPIDNLPAPDNPNARVFAARIECSKCGAVEQYQKPKHTAAIAMEQRFRRHGWFVGNGPRVDQCPDCQKKEKPALRVVPTTEPVVTGPTLVADPPREMSRDDRRIIFAKIDENWLGDAGYASPWTDVGIAKNLGVPVAWVAKVRDDMFGPAGSNPEIDELFVKHTAVDKDLRALVAEFNAVQTNVSAMRKEIERLTSEAGSIQSDINRIRKAVGK
jgi:hypothetical protein